MRWKMNKKLEIVELNLGVDPHQSAREAQPAEATKEKIEKAYTHAVKEREAIDRIKERKQNEEAEKEAVVADLIKKLIDATSNNAGLSGPEVSEIIAKSPIKIDLSSLILRIKNTLKKSDLWELNRKQLNKNSYYYLTPTKKESVDVSDTK
jgi:hypothetical protein